jgi:hypothetical protein
MAVKGKVDGFWNEIEVVIDPGDAGLPFPGLFHNLDEYVSNHNVMLLFFI